MNVRGKASPGHVVLEPSAGSAAAGGDTAGGRATFVVSVVAGVLAASASLAGLLIEGVYAGPASVAPMLRGFDLVTLVLVVPGLALALISANRGSDRGRLFWAGLLAYLAYTYAYYVFGVPFNDAFLLHVAVFSAGTFGLILTLWRVDVSGLAERFGGRTPRRAIAAVLGLLALALGGMWIVVTVQNALTGAVPAGSALVETDAVVHLGIALDLALLVPAYAAAAVLLWRRMAWGYVLAAVVLISGTLHQLSYLVAMPMQIAAGVPGAVATDPVEPVIAALYVFAAAALLRGAGRGSETTSSGVNRS